MLFYVYPLKFVFVISVNAFLGHHEAITPQQAPGLFAIYGVGFAAVFALIGLMYRHAWKLRDELQLNEVERIDTLESVYDNLSTAAFGVACAILGFLLPARLVGLAGLLYFLIFIPKSLIPARMGARRRAAEARILDAVAETPA